jgi:hypothetical protein
MLEEAMRIFGDMPVTYFSTGEYKSLEELARSSPALVGPHPNLAGKHHKSCDFENQLLEHLNRYSQATGYRCHGHMDSTWIQMKMAEMGYMWESNMCCHLEPGLKPIKMFSGLTRFPVWLEDDVWVSRKVDVANVINALETPGMKVFNFHPVHLCENVMVRSLFDWIVDNVNEWTTPNEEMNK